MDTFTPEEQKILEPFVSSIDSSIFALRNLPEVVKGALFSRYSRTTKSLRRVLLEEFIQAPESGFKDIVNFGASNGVDSMVATQKAEQFYDRVLVGYGDDSVAELANVHVALEDISNIATKFIQDARIGISPLEKSTRYVYFDQKTPQGKWLYHEEPTIMGSRHADEYLHACNTLFETYARLIQDVSKWVMEQNPRDEKTSERAYSSTIRAKTCDLLRGLLPASTITNMGAMGNGRAFEYLLLKMYGSPLAEMRSSASALHQELTKVIPSFVKRCNDDKGRAGQAYMNANDGAALRFARDVPLRVHVAQKSGVDLVDYDPEAELKLVSHILYSRTHAPLSDIAAYVRTMGMERRLEIIKSYIGERQNRRQKPGRAFENIYYGFDILSNFGAYRDIHRHRLLTQERQLLSCHHGFDMPVELEGTSFEGTFKEALRVAHDAFSSIEKSMPKEAQYVVPFAYRMRWYMRMNLREAYHLCELRSMQQGHPDYRKIAQEMYKEIRKVHSFAEMKFVDMNEYALERLESEKRLDEKLAKMK